MIRHLPILVLASFIGGSIIAAPPASAQALKTAKLCNDEYAAQKRALKAAKETKKEFVTTCRTLPVGTATPIGGVAAAPAPSAPVARQAPPASTAGTVKTAGACDAEYKANKGALKDAKEKKKDFIAACRALPPGAATPIGTATVTPPPIPAPSAPSAPAPTTQRPAPQTPAPAPTTSPAAPSAPAPRAQPAPSPTGANQFPAEASAKARCPGATVVWVNTQSRIYHFAGTKNYGNTKAGAYMCETDAAAAGDRASKTEKHP
ncbi:hypothetical protein [Beijerinckia sp. L45]|uniref:hypothetical protein n=1 Tax=Beijerinckia sp. L45 TaxID=1641855 RepID=UPI00131BF3AA|nr:hypothetical protein [Beijerinckia sp. L45]